jgi:hypothetical protein
MPRLKELGWRYERNLHVVTELLLGPHQFTVEQLAIAWEVKRDRLMAQSRPAGKRPWAFWYFDQGEESPEDAYWENRHDEAVRLAELGLLEEWELAEFKARADEARPRIGTDREQHYWPKGTSSACRDAVELWDAVQKARGE